MVPLSLHPTTLSGVRSVCVLDLSGRLFGGGSKLAPHISARSTPLRNSRSRWPRVVFHTRSNVPRSDVVMILRPSAEHVKLESGWVCAKMIGDRNVLLCPVTTEPGGDAQGGNEISWTWPACRPSRANSVEPGLVEIAIRPTVNRSSHRATVILSPVSFSAVSHSPNLRSQNPLSTSLSFPFVPPPPDRAEGGLIP